MTGLQRLHDYAEQNRIMVYTTQISFAPAVTIREEDETDGEFFHIVFDPCQVRGESAEKDVLLHELSHIAVGAFYTNEHNVYFRRKAENRTLRWQIHQAIPKDELLEAVEAGYTEPWELAELFNVSQELVEKAIHYYQRGYIDL